MALVVKNLHANAGDVRDKDLIPGLRRSPGGGHGNPFQYSCLENPMDRGAWQATVYEVAKSQTRLKQLSTHACTGLAHDRVHIQAYSQVRVWPPGDRHEYSGSTIANRQRLATISAPLHSSMNKALWSNCT